MKAKAQLLPHWCQVVGYTYLTGFLCVAAVMLTLVLLVQSGIMTMDSTVFKFIQKITSPMLSNWEVMGVINFTMFCLAAFSQEKVEDEMMLAFRLKAIFFIAMIPLVAHIILYIAPEGSAVEHLASSVINDLLGDFGFVMILYLILFKMIVWINKWRMRNEE